MNDKDKELDTTVLDQIFEDSGFDDFKWIDPKKIVVAHWVRMKCAFGCEEYGKRACCPPATPKVKDCGRFFREYTQAAIFHFTAQLENPDDRHKWSQKINKKLCDLERTVFLAGNPKAFALCIDSCSLCEECSGLRSDCKHPKKSRPGPEAMAVDVFSTVRKVGYPIEVLTDYDKTMNRYGFLMVE
jgi:predicted metal-binding protein